jgi:hypothetical protein
LDTIESSRSCDWRSSSLLAQVSSKKKYLAGKLLQVKMTRATLHRKTCQMTTMRTDGCKGLLKAKQCSPAQELKRLRAAVLFYQMDTAIFRSVFRHNFFETSHTCRSSTISSRDGFKRHRAILSQQVVDEGL